MPTPGKLEVDHRSLYRLPWTFSDNVIAWLEPTAKCNLSCEGCYRANVDEHKSLAEVESDLDTFARFRTFDSVSIAGGDPLLHPEIVEIVRRVTKRGYKAVINTNGLAMKIELLRELKRAGLVGLTFHIDSKQGRPGWRGKNELELGELRLTYAEMAASEGVSCAFNSTVYGDTLKYVPDMVEWAQQHIDKVHVMVFIVYREAVRGDYDYYQDGKPVDPSKIQYVAEERVRRADLTAHDVVGEIRKRFPDFTPAAYLGGTENPSSLKWLMAGRYGSRDKIMGYIGPRMMEATQSLHHMLRGRYFAYAPPEVLAMGRGAMATMATVDSGSRKALANYLGWVARNPLRLLKKQHYQSIMCIQPIDILPDGRQNMCEGCPDITVHNGELVWSCRLEERLNFGCFLQTVPKQCATATRPAQISAKPNGGDKRRRPVPTTETT